MFSRNSRKSARLSSVQQYSRFVEILENQRDVDEKCMCVCAYVWGKENDYNTDFWVFCRSIQTPSQKSPVIIGSFGCFGYPLRRLRSRALGLVALLGVLCIHSDAFAKEPYNHWLFCEKWRDMQLEASYGSLPPYMYQLTFCIFFCIYNIHTYVYIYVYIYIYICI